MTEVLVYDDTAERLEEIAERQDIYIAELIDEMLEEYYPLREAYDYRTKSGRKPFTVSFVVKGTDRTMTGIINASDVNDAMNKFKSYCPSCIMIGKPKNGRLGFDYPTITSSFEYDMDICDDCNSIVEESYFDEYNANDSYYYDMAKNEIIDKFEKADFEFDSLESYYNEEVPELYSDRGSKPYDLDNDNDYLVFYDNRSGHKYTFDSWNEADEWIDGVYFDDDPNRNDFGDIIEVEAVNGGNIGHYKRSPMTNRKRKGCKGETTFFNTNDVSDDAELLIEEPDDEDVEVNETETNGGEKEINVSIKNDDDTDEDDEIINVDSEDSTNPMNDMKSRKLGSRSIDI